MCLQIKSIVRSLEDLPFALSDGISVPKNTIGVIEEINNGGLEGKWLHVLWNVGGTRGQTTYNVNPSQVELA